MKANETYVLNNNLDLKDENFLVKKGTLFSVTHIYNKNDNTSPTMAGLKFDNINGIYNIDEDTFQTLEQDNTIVSLNSIYEVGDCVINQSHGQGTVQSKWYDKNLGSWLYGVSFSANSFAVAEDTLMACS